MKQYDVVEIVDKINMLSGRYPIGIKWIFKDKRDGKFRARLGALG